MAADDAGTVILAQYEERLIRMRRAPGSIRNFKIATRHFEAYLDANGLEAGEVQSWDIEQWLASEDVAHGTKKSWHALIRSAYRYAQRRGLVERVPTYDVAFEREPDREPRILSNAQLRAIKDRCTSDREWLLFHALAYTGARREEIRTLRWEDVNAEKNSIRILGKGGKIRHVPIHPALSEAMVQLRNGGSCLFPGPRDTPLSATALWNLLQGVHPGGQFHEFRRTVASSLYRNGVQPDTIDKICGWAPRVVRSRYYVNIADDQTQAAILRLYADDPV